jgi:hypothetical protein
VMGQLQARLQLQPKSSTFDGTDNRREEQSAI